MSALEAKMVRTDQLLGGISLDDDEPQEQEPAPAASQKQESKPEPKPIDKGKGRAIPTDFIEHMS